MAQCRITADRRRRRVYGLTILLGGAWCAHNFRGLAVPGRKSYTSLSVNPGYIRSIPAGLCPGLTWSWPASLLPCLLRSLPTSWAHGLCPYFPACLPTSLRPYVLSLYVGQLVSCCVQSLACCLPELLSTCLTLFPKYCFTT